MIFNAINHFTINWEDSKAGKELGWWETWGPLAKDW